MEAKVGIQERKEREKEHRKEEIVDAAQKVFFEKGLHVATVDEIAEAAELSKGTIYVYYKSKEDLYLAVVMRGMQILHDMIERVIESEHNVVKALTRLQETYFEYFEKHRNYFRMLHFLQTPQFHGQVSDEMIEAASRDNQRTWTLVIALIQRGIEEGVLLPNLNSAEIAVILWSSATQLMIRMDTESERWKNRMNLDLAEVLKLSNVLILSALLTPKAKEENQALLGSVHPRFGPVYS